MGGRRWGGTKLILGGHWKNVDPGWVVLSEVQQDITRPLQFGNDSVEVIFTEHVLEHVEYERGLFFLKECHRVLVRGGVLRIVTPDVSKILEFGLRDRFDMEYAAGHYEGRSYPADFLNVFLLNDMVKNYGHRFLWSREMLVHEMRKAGFDARCTEPGSTPYSVERRYRGIEPTAELPFYDCESCHVEGVKRC